VLVEDGFDVCAEAADASAAVSEAVRTRPDVCLVDIRMPAGGLGAAWEISSRLPETKVVMLTVSRSDRNLFAALRAGAVGYLIKDTDADELPKRLREVAEGEAALSQTLVRRVIAEFHERGPRRRRPLLRGDTPDLTSREWEVLELLRQGLTTREIAERLAVSPVTVRTHVAAVLRKLRLPDRKAAVRALEGR